MGERSLVSHLRQLSLAIPPWVGSMSAGDGYVTAKKEMVSSV